jgi:hypothetical protein
MGVENLEEFVEPLRTLFAMAIINQMSNNGCKNINTETWKLSTNTVIELLQWFVSM